MKILFRFRWLISAVVSAMFLISAIAADAVILTIVAIAVLFALPFLIRKLNEILDSKHEVVREAPMNEHKEQISSPANAFDTLKKALRDKGIQHSIEGTEPNVICYRTAVPYLSVEVTQLFENSNCGMTHWNKAWRGTSLPRAKGALGSIDISVSEAGKVVVSTMVPCGPLLDEDGNDDLLIQVQNAAERAIAQGEGLMSGIAVESFLYTPCLYIGLEPNPGQPASTVISLAESVIELFALELLRIYGETPVLAEKIISRK